MFTNGSVTIEDGRKAAEEYAPARKVSVMIAFSVPEGGDGQIYLGGAAEVANAKVAELLGLVAPAAAATPAVKPTRGKKVAEAPKSAEAPKERTKADLEREAIEAASKPAAAPLIEDESDDLSDVLGDVPAPAPVTDKEMSDACIAKANKMKTVAGWEAKRIRTLIEEFTGQPGKRVQDIAADKRKDFLDKLDALK